MRKSTLLWLGLAAFCGITLFHTSQKVHDSREKLAALTRDIGREEESLSVLQAEWSYLNQPRRLEKLAKQYLKLAPLKGAQFVKAEDIALRPAAAAAPEPHVALSPEPAVVVSNEPPLIPQKKSNDKRQTASNSRKFGDVMKSFGAGQ
ncbi:MAG: hypothetical protein K8R48_06155 [Alphaproteobacteria bacterium]|nr:hypothetical protein [Alphaproteobacteria bacterium]